MNKLSLPAKAKGVHRAPEETPKKYFTGFEKSKYCPWRLAIAPQSGDAAANAW